VYEPLCVFAAQEAPISSTGSPLDPAAPAIPASYFAAAREQLTVDQRIALARKDEFLQPSSALSEAERDVLRRIIQVIAQDAEIRVRQALAETLAENPEAPHAIVVALATDDAVVADPILRLSEVLKPEDLVAIIESQKSLDKMAAIAARRGIPPTVCMAMIEHGDDKIAGVLLQNPGANISDAGLNRMVDRHGNAAVVQKGLINRDALPATVIEKVVSLASSDLLTRLIERHNLPPAASAKLITQMRDRAILGFSGGLSSEGMSSLVDQLLAEDRLNPSLVFRSLAVGNVELIVHVIALRCHLGIQYVRDRLVQLSSDVQKLWTAADLPANYLPMALASIGVLLEARRDNAKWTAEQCRARITEKILADCEGLDRLLSAEDLRFLEAGRGA